MFVILVLMYDTFDMDIYRDVLMEHSVNPLNIKLNGKPTHVGKAKNALCGDVVVLNLIVKDNKVVDISHESDGCVVATASASLLTEAVRGKTVEDVLALTMEDLLDLLGTGLTTSRRQCAKVVLEALRNALTN